MNKQKRQAFKDWLQAAGAELLEPTSEWEIVRFKSGADLGIVYRNKHETITPVGAAVRAYNAFIRGRRWRAMKATKRKSMGGIIPSIRKRDGDLCFYCNKFVDEYSASAEHLVAVTHGGPNHIANLVLAHKSCNEKAGHLSVAEKIKLRLAVLEMSVFATISAMDAKTETHNNPPWET